MARIAVAVALAALAVVALATGQLSPEAEEPPALQLVSATPAPDAAVPPPDEDPPRRPRTVRFTLAATGDLLVHAPVWQRALRDGGGARYDFAPLLRPVRRYVRGADVALCHVETPLAPGAPEGYPIFRTPPALARAIRETGWDACSTASNHTLDGGEAGVSATLRALDRAGVRHAGSYRSAAGRRRTTFLRVRGVRLAFLAYTTTTNGLQPPHPWSVAMAEPRRIVRDARRARRRGADVVVVNLHWGDEYRHEPSAAQRALARRLTASRAITAIVGQHAHVVQPIRRVRGKVVVFGEGNLVSNQSAACCPAASQDGLIALLRFEVGGGRARVTRVRYVPTWVRHPDLTVLPVRRALREGWADPAALRASWRRTVAAVGRSAARPSRR